MTEKEDTSSPPHIGWAIPIILYLITQTTLAVWWASNTTASLHNIEQDLEQYITANDSENLRQWARINENEDDIARIVTELARTNANIENLNRNIKGIDVQIGETNTILKEYLLNKNPPN